MKPIGVIINVSGEILASWKLLILVFTLVQTSVETHRLYLPLLGEAEVNINVPQGVGQLLGSILNTNKRYDGTSSIWQHALGPLSVNVNLQPNNHQQQQHQAYQYNAENYQYMPPPPPATYQMGGYYPYNQQSSQYLPAHMGYYGSGYYPMAPAAPYIQHSPPQQPQIYEYPTHGHSENPYMRAPYPNRAILPTSDKSYDMPPLAPIQELRKTPDIKKGTIVTPDSPWYKHIPEETPTMAFDPR
uniref:Uncharacterized protein n=1 Tax=Stomoxys calcitrans TaxID=35570 RepID=A0A1I8NSU3_STOCA